MGIFYFQGMIELRNALSDVVDEFGTDAGGSEVGISCQYMGEGGSNAASIQVFQTKVMQSTYRVDFIAERGGVDAVTFGTCLYEGIPQPKYRDSQDIWLN